MLLAAHPEWQSRARAEVMDVVRRGEPLDADMIRKLKTVTMVVQETLRLYPPGPFVTREARRDLRLGGLDVPSGTGVRVPVALAHRDPAAWGPDPDRFDPNRFANGVAGACRPPHMYMPFGVGARTCAGQNLAVAEVKVVLALLLPRFELALSPGSCTARRSGSPSIPGVAWLLYLRSSTLLIDYMHGVVVVKKAGNERTCG